MDACAIIGVNKKTYIAWEKGENTPSVEKMISLADFLNVSIDYILKRDEYVGQQGKVVAELPLSLDTPIVDKTPVYSHVFGWMLVNSETQECILADGSRLPFSQVGEVFAGSPADVNGQIKYDKPIAQDDLMQHTRVWVEPISRDSFLSEQLRGWYNVGDRYVFNDFGHRFYFAAYQNQWVAFEETQGKDSSEQENE